MLVIVRHWRVRMMAAWSAWAPAQRAGWIAPPILALVAACWWQSQTLALADREAAGRHARQRLDALLAQHRLPAQGPGLDFAMTLPVHAPSLPALSLVRRAAELYGVEVQALGATDQAPTVSALGRMGVEASLRGRYGPIKQMLAEVLNHGPGRVLVQSLTLRRPGNGPELEARLVLAWPTRPAAALVMPGEQRTAKP